ncbi:MAG TPA: hypothetical protein VGG62_02725 [Terracidiphilus sp.]|jgi:hypothetical protein
MEILNGFFSLRRQGDPPGVLQLPAGADRGMSGAESLSPEKGPNGTKMLFQTAIFGS